MFDSFEDEPVTNNESFKYFKFENFYSVTNSSLSNSSKTNDNFMEFDDDDNENDDNNRNNINDNDDNYRQINNLQKEKKKKINHLLDKSLSLYSQNENNQSTNIYSNKHYINQLIKNKIDLYLNRPFDIISDLESQNTSVLSTSSSKSLKEKLFDLYLEESKRNNSKLSDSKFLNYSTNLLEKLVKKENYNTVVLNFYQASQGFSLSFNIKTLESKYCSSDNNNNTKSNDFKNDLFDLNNIETKFLSYDETDLLFYINTGEIPPILIDLIDHLNVNLFYDGCLILEIRDYRRKLANNRSSSSNTNGTTSTTGSTSFNFNFKNNSFINSNQQQQSYDLHYVLLQPSMQTLLADINSITNSGNYIWTQEDKYALESQLLLATQQPLCLNPSPIVSIIKNELLSYKYKMNDRTLKKFALRYSESNKIRAFRWQEYSLPYPFRILTIRKKYENTNEYLQFQNDYLNKLNDIKLVNNNNNISNSTNCKQENTQSFNNQFNEIKLFNNNNSNSNSSCSNNNNNHKLSSPISNINFNSIDNWAKASHIYKLPSDDMILVKKFAKSFEIPKYTNEPVMSPIEEIILEAIDKTSKNNYSKLLIKRRSDDGSYFCQLTLRIDHKNDVLFRLGTASEAEKYIQQYVKIFTEEGRRAVTVKHNLLEKLSDSTKNLINENNSKHLNNNGINNNLVNYSNSTLRKPVNTSPVLSGVSFQNFFDSKIPLDFNDKQIQSYQLFLQQQYLHQKQQQQQLLQQQQQQQQQLEQIRRTKSSDEQSLNISSSNSNLKNLIVQNSPSNVNCVNTAPVSIQLNQNHQNLLNQSNQHLTGAKLYANIQPARSNSLNDSIIQRNIVTKKQSEPIISTTTTTAINPATNPTNIQTSGLIATNTKSSSVPSNNIDDTSINHSQPSLLQYQQITTTKINPTPTTSNITPTISLTSTPSSSSSSSNNGQIQNPTSTQNQNNSYIQIYVPKLISTTNTSNNNSPNQTASMTTNTTPTTTTKILSSPTTNSNNSIILGNNQNLSTLKVPAKITETQNSNTTPSNTKKSQSQKVNTTPKRQPKKRTNSSSTTPVANTSQLNLAPKVIQSKPLNEPEKNQIKTAPNTKIINASNLNLLKKIAIDNRTVPVIVTLNSNDSSNEQNSNQQQQLQQPTTSQHIKLLNNKLTIKPQITTSIIQNPEESPVKTTTSHILTTSNLSPIKTTTVQLLQKTTPFISLNSSPNITQNITNKLTTLPLYQNTNNNSDLTTTLITPVSSICSPLKKNDQNEVIHTKLGGSSESTILITSPSTKQIQPKQNFILPSTVKTIPINQNSQFNTKTSLIPTTLGSTTTTLMPASTNNPQFLTTSNLIDNNQSQFISAKTNQSTASLILVTNNSNSNTKLIQTDNSKS